MKISVFFAHIQQMAADEGCSLEAAMLAAKSYGIEAVEIDWNEARNAPSEFLLTVEACGMKVSSCYGFIDLLAEGGLDEGKRFVDCVSKLKAGNAMILPGAAESVEKREARREALVAPLTELAAYAKARGTSLSLEDFSQKAAPYSLTEDFTYLFANVPNLCFTLDTGNFAYNCEDSYDALRAICPECLRLSHVHLKNYLLEKPDGEYFSAGHKPENHSASGENIFAYPITGGGSMPVAEILAYLKRYNYSGYLSIENFGVLPMSEGLRTSAAWIAGQIG